MIRYIILGYGAPAVVLAITYVIDTYVYEGKTYNYQYKSTMQLEHQSIRQLGLSIDGLRSGGEDTLIYLGRAPELQYTTVPAPQVG